jgi:histidyl-tRNA synthetase
VDKPRMDKQLAYTLEQRVPFMVLFGETEVQAGLVNLKDMRTGQKNDRPVPRADVRAGTL